MFDVSWLAGRISSIIAEYVLSWKENIENNWKLIKYTVSNQYEWPDLKIKIKTRAVPHGSMDYGTMSKVQSLIRREIM